MFLSLFIYSATFCVVFNMELKFNSYLWGERIHFIHGLWKENKILITLAIILLILYEEGFSFTQEYYILL